MTVIPTLGVVHALGYTDTIHSRKCRDPFGDNALESDETTTRTGTPNPEPTTERRNKFQISHRSSRVLVSRASSKRLELHLAQTITKGL
jgi:hypothetical protein